MLDREDEPNQRVERKAFEPFTLLLVRVRRTLAVLPHDPLSDAYIDSRTRSRERNVALLAEPRKIRRDYLLVDGRVVADLMPALGAGFADDELRNRE